MTGWPGASVGGRYSEWYDGSARIRSIFAASTAERTPATFERTASGHGGKRLEGGAVEGGVGQRRNVRVARALLRDGQPGALAAVHASVDLDKEWAARVAVFHLDLRVSGAVGELDGVEHTEDVGNHAAVLAEVVLHLQAAHAVVDDRRVVGDPPLVVHPERHALVHPVARDGVDDELVAAQVLLQEDADVLKPEHVDRAGQRREGVPDLVG
eukprot:scaffold6748_cov122-Isochrysis_galbana.AAC.13